ncbi:conjugal transfer protein TrbB [Mycolicibacterium mageritense]|uniref:conjugal transfer protein TrbB n=1 Tax=Mycolicibacterium mageritense TaxID=53462 RepID=UPI0011DBA6BE|nr:conjugal transfer protein TrbB [Mycolicibacterium mageritense]TXI56037.1 MAG: conjugal transfer protein TrbB [Mycolicibacterium mageritense]
MLAHVGRDGSGRRRLAEIAVLGRGADGSVHVRTAWHVDSGFGCGAEHLKTLIAERGTP